VSRIPELVGVNDIAAKTGVTRFAVHRWVRGDLGPFPKPVYEQNGRREGQLKIWSWPAVRNWIRRNRRIKVQSKVQSHIDYFNSRLRA